jgi:hypothetical protein
VAHRVVQQRGLPRARRRRCAAGGEGLRPRRGDRLKALRRRADRDPQPPRRAGRPRLAPAQHRGALRRRPGRGGRRRGNCGLRRRAGSH